ncbi:unnamed protein product [Cunninghamella echinulata]
MIIDPHQDLTSLIINEEEYDPHPSWHFKKNNQLTSIRNKTTLTPTPSLSSPLSSSLPPPLPIVHTNNYQKEKEIMYPIRIKSINCPHSHLQQQQRYVQRRKKPQSISTPSSPVLNSSTTTTTNNNNNNNNNNNQKKKSSFESPLLLPSRARSVFGIQDPQQQKEQKVISAWRNTVTHILQQEFQRSIPSAKLINIHDDIKSLSLRKFIINEIYTTEKSYYELLVFTKKRYMEPIMKAVQAKDPLVKSDDIPLLFTHLSSLINLSETILNGFHHQDKLYFNNSSCSNNNNNATLCIGQLWLNLYEEWTIFLKYAVHYESNTKSIKRACNNVLVLRINQEYLTRKESKRMGIADYLIAPIQRVPRYLLLLKDLLRHTPMDNEDYESIDRLVQIISALAMGMNNTQKIHRRKTS